MRDKKWNYEKLPEEVLSFDLDVEEAKIDPALLEKIEREFKGEVFNHPFTLWPFLIGGGSLAYAIGLAPLLGGFLVAIPVGAAALLVAVGNGAYRLIHVGEKYAIKRSELEVEGKKIQEAEERRKIERSVKFLRAELARVSGSQASRTSEELEQLVDAFTLIDREMAQHNEGLFMQHMSRSVGPSVKHAYKEGLRVVLCLSELLREDSSLNRSTLQREIQELENELERLRSEPKERHRLIEIKENALLLRRQRLEKADWRDDMIEEFIHRVDTCEEVLRTTRENLMQSRAEQSDARLEEMLDRLKNQIAIMRRIQQEFKNSEGLSLGIK